MLQKEKKDKLPYDWLVVLQIDFSYDVEITVYLRIKIM